VVCALLAGGTSAVHAQWDVSGTVSAREMWAENTTFTAKAGNGDAITAIKLFGRLVRTGRIFRLDASYSPDAQFHRDLTVLNRVSHEADVRAGWDLSARSTLSFTERLLYTPDQGLNQGSTQTPNVFTRFTDRRNHSAGLAFKHSLSPRGEIVLSARQYFQTFSDPILVDSAGYGLGVSYKRQVAPRTSVDVGAGNAWNRFGHTDEITGLRVGSQNQVTSPFASVYTRFGNHVTLSSRAGYNVSTPADSSLPRRRGALLQSSLQWSGTKLRTDTGYSRDFSTGSGPTELSQSQTFYGSSTYEFTKSLQGSINLNRTISENLARGGADRIVRNFNGQATLTLRTGRSMSLFCGFSRYLQSSQQPQAPDLAFNRYTVGLQAGFR